MPRERLSGGARRVGPRTLPVYTEAIRSGVVLGGMSYHSTRPTVAVCRCIIRCIRPVLWLWAASGRRQTASLGGALHSLWSHLSFRSVCASVAGSPARCKPARPRAKAQTEQGGYTFSKQKGGYTRKVKRDPPAFFEVTHRLPRFAAGYPFLGTRDRTCFLIPSVWPYFYPACGIPFIYRSSDEDLSRARPDAVSISRVWDAAMDTDILAVLFLEFVGATPCGM